MLVYLILLVLSGLIVGALGRLAVPGPNPMSIPKTILIGIGATLIAGIVMDLLFDRTAGLIVSVLAAAGIVYLLERNEQNRVR